MRSGTGRIGIAIAADGIGAILRRGDAVHVEHVAPPDDAPLDANGSMDAAFAGLAARIAAVLGREPAGVSLDVALLPPFTDARLVPLPPLRRAEAEDVLRRDAARHFVGGAGPRTVAVHRTGATDRRTDGPAPVFAAAAPAVFLDAVHAAARRAGFRVHRFTPAHAAWIAAAQRLAGPAGADNPISIVAVDGDVVHAMRVERDAVVVLRRIPAGDVAGIGAAIGAGPGTACVFADHADRLLAALTAAGWNVVRGGGSARAAAEYAGAGTLELVPDAVRAERDERLRARARRLATAAALLLVAAAAVHAWGAHRQLEAVRREREAIRADVAPLLATRDSLDRLRERTDALRALAAAPQWTRAIFDIAMLLPADAWVLSLRATGDTLIIDAEGARAGAALQALRTAASLRNVAIQGTVERELEDGATALERFTLRARLATTTDSTPVRRADAAAPGGAR